MDTLNTASLQSQRSDLRFWESQNSCRKKSCNVITAVKNLRKDICLFGDFLLILFFRANGQCSVVRNKFAVWGSDQVRSNRRIKIRYYVGIVIITLQLFFRQLFWLSQKRRSEPFSVAVDYQRKSVFVQKKNQISRRKQSSVIPPLSITLPLFAGMLIFVVAIEISSSWAFVTYAVVAILAIVKSKFLKQIESTQKISRYIVN